MIDDAQWLRTAEELRLSAREMEIVKSLITGATRKEIAQILMISPCTVRTHIERLYRKVGVRNRTSLVVRLLTATNSSPTIITSHQANVGHLTDSQ